MLTLAAHVFITAGFFVLTSLFHSEGKDKTREQREQSRVDLATPVFAHEGQDEYDRQQRSKLGIMVMMMGGGVALMSLIPNELWGRAVFVLCAIAISTVGLLLKRSSRVAAHAPRSGSS